MLLLSVSILQIINANTNTQQGGCIHDQKFLIKRCPDDHSGCISICLRCW